MNIELEKRITAFGSSKASSCDSFQFYSILFTTVSDIHTQQQIFRHL